jgi:hypothetical protein
LRVADAGRFATRSPRLVPISGPLNTTRPFPMRERSLPSRAPIQRMPPSRKVTKALARGLEPPCPLVCCPPVFSCR